MKKIILSLLLFFIVNYLFSQDFYRIIEVKDVRMYGTDVVRLQTKLVENGFNEIGKIDGYYGPLTESTIKNIQYFLGFEQNGKVDKKLWDFLFDESNKAIFEKINYVLKYDINEFEKETARRMGYSTEGGSVEKYFLNNEIKYLKLSFYGEIFQNHNYFHYIDSNNYFIIVENYRYPFPIYYLLLDPNKMDALELERNAYELEVIANDEFWKKTIIEYKTYMKVEDGLFEIKNGKYFQTDFNLDWYIKVIEDEKANRY